MFRIRDILKEKGLLVKDLAITVKVAPPNMSKIVNGKLSPSLTLLVEIAKALDVEVWELFQGSQMKDTKSDINPVINGYIEIGGEIKRIKSIKDLDAVMKAVEQISSQEG